MLLENLFAMYVEENKIIMTLSKDVLHLNLTNKEYMALSVEKRIELAEKLPSNGWDFYSEANPDIAKPDLPCVIDGVIIGE